MSDELTPGQRAEIEKWGNKFIGLGMLVGFVLGTTVTFLIMSLKVFS